MKQRVIPDKEKQPFAFSQYTATLGTKPILRQTMERLGEDFINGIDNFGVTVPFHSYKFMLEQLKFIPNKAFAVKLAAHHKNLKLDIVRAHRCDEYIKRGIEYAIKTEYRKFSRLMLNSDKNVQVSDTTEDDKSGEAGKQNQTTNHGKANE